MRAKGTKLGLAAALALWGSPALGEGSGKPAPTAGEAGAKASDREVRGHEAGIRARSVEGTIESFDASSRTLKLSGHSPLELSGDARIRRHGQQAGPEDLLPGERVLAYVSGQGRAREVSRVEIQPAEGPGAEGTGSGSGSGSEDRDRDLPLTGTSGYDGAGTGSAAELQPPVRGQKKVPGGGGGL